MKITWPRDVFAAPLIGVLAALLFGATVIAGAQDVLPLPDRSAGRSAARERNRSKILSSPFGPAHRWPGG